MADRSTLSEMPDDVPQTPKLRLIPHLTERSTWRPAPLAADAWDDTVPPPTRPTRLAGSTRLMLAGFLVILGFLAGVAAQKHHDAGYLSPDAVARISLNSTPAQPANAPVTSEVPHTTVPNAQ
jgi:hypothetical protein